MDAASPPTAVRLVLRRFSPRREAVYVQASALTLQRPQRGATASHLRCLRRQASQASGAGRGTATSVSTMLYSFRGQSKGGMCFLHDRDVMLIKLCLHVRFPFRLFLCRRPRTLPRFPRPGIIQGHPLLQQVCNTFCSILTIIIRWYYVIWIQKCQR
jgi:hypothetical protein